MQLKKIITEVPQYLFDITIGKEFKFLPKREISCAISMEYVASR